MALKKNHAINQLMLLLWRPKRNYSCFHPSLALGSSEFTFDFQGISDFFQPLPSHILTWV